MRITQIARQPTDFQQPVDEAPLRTALARELQDREILAVEELAGGLFNNTYRVSTENGDLILKVAPHPDADVFFPETHLMAREQTLAPTLQSVSSLIPAYLRFFHIGRRRAFLQPFLQGELWHDKLTTLSEDENGELWAQLGQFARAIHGHEGETFGYPLPHCNAPKWSSFLAQNVDGMLEDARRLNVAKRELLDFRELIDQFRPLLDEVSRPRLLHGDLWPRNVLFEGRGAHIQIKAIFDAERAFWGDPISDWVLVLYDLPEAFWRGYGINLLATTNPARVAIYRGMYFMLNILESTRFDEPDVKYMRLLAGVNRELASFS